jgi:hypothetical protein
MTRIERMYADMKICFLLWLIRVNPLESDLIRVQLPLILSYINS